ncbi:hypothetical protein CH63R_12789 [Colletotrichum higginsianum IMI 349063]|uniref:Uncharacterized protein n=1 Tax=Colletotrichum higginsianum (strain IMI 349063) TaxID=759273 RepID=A0A1B7XV47_COLHI|nr:hypothetical protein CH63R_12789 [Colletotrichum higginsianum IMI 349063]OBR03662.1 hypothetical protein CH63R_12789 [Colletotrichum higginsianum IMI 349063]
MRALRLVAARKKDKSCDDRKEDFCDCHRGTDTSPHADVLFTNLLASQATAAGLLRYEPGSLGLVVLLELKTFRTPLFHLESAGALNPAHDSTIPAATAQRLIEPFCHTRSGARHRLAHTDRSPPPLTMVYLPYGPFEAPTNWNVVSVQHRDLSQFRSVAGKD